jgi:hypothetical protein
MQRTRVIETEINTPTSVGAATSISNATCVRLHNTTNSSVTVAIASSVGSATTNYFSMPGNSVEFLEKSPTDVIWTSSEIKANKVGFTN